MKLRDILVVLSVLSASASAQALELAPFKDSLFAYADVLKSGDNGNYLVIDYQEMRDINGRDAIPERRVKDAYVSLQPKRSQRDLKVSTPSGTIKVMAVGRLEGASAIVIYLHGQGGNRQQGMNDYTFGGNFNRLKNLMHRNGGLYLSPDFSDFGEKGEAQIAALIEHFSAASPNAPIIVACGSAGGQLCWRLAENAPVSKKMSGLMLLGSLWDEAFLKSPAARRRVPVFFAHGSRDPVFPVDKQEAFYRAIKGNGGYPARFHRFESGSHGTPIRMADWRGILNWMLKAPPR
ncbi:MAG: alpha/beta hydrolase [Phyllobacterium sp.]